MLTTARLLPGYKPTFRHRSHDNRVESECLHPAFSGLEAVSGGPSGIVGTREPRDMRCLSDRHFSRLQSGKVYDLSTCRTRVTDGARNQSDRTRLGQRQRAGTGHRRPVTGATSVRALRNDTAHAANDRRSRRGRCSRARPGTDSSAWAGTGPCWRTSAIGLSSDGGR
jgi:hypothetical protein